MYCIISPTNFHLPPIFIYHLSSFFINLSFLPSQLFVISPIFCQFSSLLQPLVLIMHISESLYVTENLVPSIWHSKECAAWYILIIKAKKMHHFSTSFGKELYMFQTDLLSISRSLNTIFTVIVVMLTVCQWGSWPNQQTVNITSMKSTSCCE